MNTVLCKLSELPDRSGREFEANGRKVFAVRDGSEVFVYLNLCPHLGTPLNWEPDAFLDEAGALIRCSTHGALFEKDTGKCILGPCQGMYLSSVPVSVEDNDVMVEIRPVQPYQPFPAKD
jgi:nitrite reductase/ring-hydroxylating ferredoxin subunit